MKFLGGIIMNFEAQKHTTTACQKVTEGPQITALEPQGLTPINVPGTLDSIR